MNVLISMPPGTLTNDDERMANEIERKFLVESIPEDLHLGAGTHLRQGYVAQDGNVEIRVRVTTDASWLTIKAGSGLVRTEVELPLSPADADALWDSTGGRRLEKERFAMRIGDATVELDVYGGALEGLRTAEVEFTDEDQAAAFVPPSWFGREVTSEPGWSNAALARDGRPD